MSLTSERSESSTPLGRRALRIAVACCWAASVTLTMQYWIGNTTIYRGELANNVRQAHTAIVENRPPSVSWTSRGMNSTNIRVGVVFVAEAVHRATGKDVLTVYRLIDTCALFAGLLTMLAFLFATVPPSYAVVGAAGFASVLPLTYQLFYFHPWDRVSLVGWLLLLLLLKRGRLLAFTALLAIVMLVKSDVVLLPGLVFLCNAPWPLRRNALVRTSAITAGLFCLTFGIYWMLQMLRPGGFEPVPSAWELVVRNWELFGSMKWGYPPLLGFTVIGVLAIIGFRWTDRFGRACAVFAAGMMFVLVISSNFAEFRAEVPVFILLLPVALDGLRGLLEGRRQLPSSAA